MASSLLRALPSRPLLVVAALAGASLAGCGEDLPIGQLPISCLAEPVCPPHSIEAAEEECTTETCFEVTECGSTILCMDEPESCDWEEACESSEWATLEEPCADDDLSCRKVDFCDETVFCHEILPPGSGECEEPIPCDPATNEISDVGCADNGEVCSEHEWCGEWITCRPCADLLQGRPWESCDPTQPCDGGSGQGDAPWCRVVEACGEVTYCWEQFDG